MTETARTAPRIASITTSSVDFPLDVPMADAVHYIPGRAALLVEVTCDDGRVGTGESAIYGGSASAIEALIHDVLAPRALGADPTRPELLWQRMLWPSHQLGTGGALPMALAGIDIAVWDLLGQLAGLPLFRLLGGHQDRVRAYASGGFYLDGKDAAALAEEFKACMARGYRHGKLKVGRTPDTPMNPLAHMVEPDFATVSLAEDLARVGAVREAVGDDFHLMVDANNAWDLSTALAAGREFDRLGVHWFEEPVATDDRVGSARLAAALDVPVAGYETETQLSGFRDLIGAGAVDIVQPDVIWAGGITGCRRIAALAYAAGLRCVPHVYSTAVSIAANLHFMASLPNCYLLEFDQNPNALRTELLTEPIEPDADAVVTVPDRPGLGIRLDRTTMSRYAMAPPRTSELP
ncbi:MAG TPA: mandelate racemase/muconate lactonizing enzyme family protein [Actinomycetota bacterium]|jgi:L-alanine-DL-glutamate epimerase-like enolase superfamily enzyme|nr:mandelate racemase/muconate lactonizing enzyme family protein [Actinomycetota bacterium]